MIYLIAGHHNEDPGAVSKHTVGTIKEADLTKELRDLIYQYLVDIESINDIKRDNDSTVLSKLISDLDKVITTEDLLVDIHFNAFNGKATGTEVIIPKLSSSIEKDLASLIAEHTSDILSISNRGVKGEDKTARGKIGILKGKGHRILLEVCFMDNPKDFTSYMINKYILAAKIAELIHDHYVKKIHSVD